jgi:hypothetical protein
MPKGGTKPPRPKPRQKSKPEPLPTLPQHRLPEPYSRLMEPGLKEDKALYEQVAAWVRANGLEAGISQLLQMALDESYYGYLGENYEFSSDPRVYTRLQAVRALTQLGPDAASVVEPLLPLLDEEDDDLREEMPFLYAAIGEVAIERLSRYLMDADVDMWARSGAGDALAEMAEKRPDLRPQIVPILEQALLTAGEEETLAGYIIVNLLDIGSVESLPVIEQAFNEDRVDLSVVQMPDVQEHFGLPVTVEWVPIRWGGDDEFEDEDDELGEEIVAEEMGLPPTDAPDGPVQTPFVAGPKVGRNEPCPCGSGKKYKKCCGA